MNKFFMMALISTLFSLAHAGTFSDLNLDKILENGRTEAHISKFSIKNVNWGTKINQLRKKHGNCGEADVKVSRYDSMEALRLKFGEEKLEIVLNKLLKQQKLSRAMYASDGSEGLPENCSTSSIEFYSLDGEVLKLYFDYNS